MPAKKSSVVSRQSSDKKVTTKKVAETASLRAVAKQSRSETTTKKIATSTSSPRNDKKAAHLNLSVPVYSLAGKETGSLNLPKEIFGQKINKSLLSQALRSFMSNQKLITASTKTRGEVEGSTAKIFRQKGTGRARHGAIRAPIFVGGGIVFGPKPRKVRLDLPKKMKKAALLSALSSKVADKSVFGLTGLEKASGKTKEISKLLAVSSLQLVANSKKPKPKSTLIVTEGKMDNVIRAARNLPEVTVLSANLINAYEVLKHELLLISKDAVEKIGKTSASLSQDSSLSKRSALKGEGR